MAKMDISRSRYSSMDNVNHAGLGIRHIQALLLFLVAVFCYTMRSAMGVAILAMTDHESNHTDIKTYQWDKKTQDTVMSSFYWGYTLMQIPSGIMAHHFGGWILILMALTVNCLGSFATPWIAEYGGWKAVCAIRMVQGLGQSALFPSVHSLLSKWIPISERGRIATFVYSGVNIGTTISMPLAGLLTTTSSGWPTIFYTCGFAAFIMEIFYYFLGSNDPIKHKTISTKERKFIEASTGAQSNHTKVLPTPWKSIMTSIPMMALCLVHIGNNWAFLTLLLETPSYMNKILDIDIQQSGLLSALPFLAAWIIATLSSFVNDYLINSKICSITTTRKIMNSVGTWPQAVFMILITFLPEGSTVLAIATLTIIMGLSSITSCGYLINHMDLAPNFSGILMGMTNSVANLFSIGAPILAGFILNDQEDNVARWQIVFCTAASILLFTNLIFVIFGSGEIQHWNNSPASEDKTGNPDESTAMKPLSDKVCEDYSP